MPVKRATITHFAIPNLNLHDKTQEINIKNPGKVICCYPGERVMIYKVMVRQLKSDLLLYLCSIL